MTSYDPLKAPSSEEWRELDEQEQISLVKEYHRQAGVELPNELVHATFHVVVENQVALGSETPVEATLDRLMREGLNRHDAIHAVGSVLAGSIHDLMHGRRLEADPSEAYYEDLKGLTADGWLRRFE